MIINSKLPKFRWWEWAVILLACASLIISCYLISAKKHFWNDELYSYYFIAEPSFTKMLVAFHDKINNTPIFYFALGWVWDKLFGASEFSLRLFTSLGMCLALGVVWLTLRRFYSFWATTIGVLIVFATSPVIILQNAEARMYGLYLALTALALWIYQQFYQQRKPAGIWLWLNALVHVALVHTHLFGGFYSGAILVCLFLCDWYFKIFRPRVYLSIVLSWLTILFYIPSFLIQADAGKPRTWIPAPAFIDLLDVLNITNSVFFARIFLLLPIIFLGLYLFRKRRNVSKALPPNFGLFSSTEVPILVFGLALMAMPLCIWLFSHTIKPIFYDRYLIPTALGWVILFTWMLNYIFSLAANSEMLKGRLKLNQYIAIPFVVFPGLALLFLLLLNPLLKGRRFEYMGFNDRVLQLHEYNHLPIVVQASSNTFVQGLHYSATPDKYYFIIDREAAVDENSGTFAPQEYKHLQALKRQYPVLFKNVVTTTEFLQKHDRFLVLDYVDFTRKCPLKIESLRVVNNDMLCPQWVEMRLLNNTAYKMTELEQGEYAKYFSVLLFEKQNSRNAAQSSAN